MVRHRRRSSLLGLIVVSVGAALWAVPAFATVTAGMRFSRPASSANANDLHIKFKPGWEPSPVTHIPSPPSPAGDISWPVVSVNGGTVHFSGTSMPAPGTSSYKFVFPNQNTSPLNPDDIIDVRTWTNNGNAVSASMEVEWCPFEA